MSGPRQRWNRRAGVGYLFYVVGLLACLSLGAAVEAWGLNVTPSIEVGVGHDDNIKIEKDPKGDFFYFVRPQITLQAGQQDDRLEVQGRAEYDWYSRHNSESRLQEATLGANWRHAFSSTWFLDAASMWTRSQDAAELDETGRLTQVRNVNEPRDRFTTSVRSTTLLGPSSQAFVGTSVSKIYNNDSTIEDITYYKTEAGLVYRLLPHWRTEAKADYVRDDWQKSEDINRYNAELTLVHMFDSTTEAYVGGSVGTVRSETDSSFIRQTRDYDIYSAWLGYKDQVTPEFGYELSAGASYVEANEFYNGAAGKVFPTGKASVSYRRPLHVWRAYAEMKLGEYDSLGQNTGITNTRRVGASWQWDLAQHWRFFAQADFIDDDFQQTNMSKGVTPQGDVQSVRLGATLSYRIARYWKISLDYRYLSRDTEFHADDVAQNRIMMIVSAEWPQRW